MCRDRFRAARRDIVGAMRRAPLVALAGLCACPPPSSLDPDALTSAQPDPSGSSAIESNSEEGMTATSSTGEPPVTTGEPDETTGPATTDDGTTTTTTTTTGSDPTEVTTGRPNLPPEILSLKTTPAVVSDAGIVTLAIDATEDSAVAKIVFGEVEAMIDITGSPTFFDVEVTSQTMCTSTQFEVTVFDEHNLSDFETLALDCQMPQSGTEMFTTPLDGDSAADVALLPDGGALVAGVKGSRMAVWAVDAAGEVKFGWPKVITNWSLDPKFDALPSFAATVARDADGSFYVGGAVKEAGGLRRYLAKFNSQGFLIWEDAGAVLGEEIAGMAVSSDGVAVAVGSIRTSAVNEPPTFDMGVWGYPPEFPQVQEWVDQFKAPASDPDPENARPERGQDAAALPNGEVIVVCERLWRDENNFEFQRATTLRYTSDGARLGEPWTSTGFKFKHDGARSVTRTAEGYAIVGWGEHENNPQRQLLAQRFDLAGKFLGVQHESSPAWAQGEGIAQDREKKLVVAATTFADNTWGAWIFATLGADQPHPWQQVESKAIAAAIECDEWGACTWVGTIDANGMSAAVVSKRAP
jgi:hypothetical protein